MKVLIGFMLALAMTSAASAQTDSVPASRLVLKVTAVDVPSADAARRAAAATVTLHLESGATVTVPLLDVDWQRSRELGPAAPTSTAAVSAPPGGIRAKCTKDWPSDFVMRAACERQQQESVSTLQGRSMTTSDQRMIRNKCATDWPDDFTMRNACETQQLKALDSLR